MNFNTVEWQVSGALTSLELIIKKLQSAFETANVKIMEIEVKKDKLREQQTKYKSAADRAERVIKKLEELIR